MSIEGRKIIFDGRQMNVLLVDDSSTMRRFIRNHLRKMGITKVLEASDGREALDVLFNKMQIELIFLDMDMPIMDGMDCLDEIRASHHFQNKVVILLSSEFDESIKKKALHAGANDYLVKPFSFEELKEKVLRFFG